MSGKQSPDAGRRDGTGSRQAWRERLSSRNRVFRGTVRDGWGAASKPLVTARDQVQRWVQPRRKWVYPSGGLVIAVAAGLLPFLGSWFALPEWLAHVTSGSVLSVFALNVLFALGLNVVVGFAGLLDLGYVAFWAIGAYSAGVISGASRFSIRLTSIPPLPATRPTWHEWMWLIFLAALLIAVLAGIILGSPTLRLRGDYLAIVTLGFGEIVRITANNLDSLTNGPIGIQAIPHPEAHVAGVNLVWGDILDNKYYWLLLAFVVLWVVAIRMLDNSRIGRAWVAIREDEVAAAAMGVPVVRMKLAAFAIGACTAGVGGVVFAQQLNAISPNNFVIIQSILILAMVVIGGMGSVIGAIIGAGLVTLLPEIFRGLTDYRFFIFGLGLVIVMAFRPQGLVPSRRRKLELGGRMVDEQLYEARRG